MMVQGRGGRGQQNDAAAACLVVAEDQLESLGLEPIGSGISLGHPIGATGVRIMTTMLRELRRRSGRYALETMCVGGSGRRDRPGDQ